MHTDGFTSTISSQADIAIENLWHDVKENIYNNPNHRRYYEKVSEANTLKNTLGYILMGAKIAPTSSSQFIDAKLDMQIYTLEEITIYLRASLCANLCSKRPRI